MKKGSLIKLILIVLVVELAIMAVYVWPDISNRIYQTTDSPAMVTEGSTSSIASTATTQILNPTRTPYFFYFKKVASKTPSPTATSTSTNTYTPTRQFFPSRTPIYTLTGVPQNNPTNTPVPPTNTSAPPTNTSAPPTNTQAPPTNTQAPPTPAATPTVVSG